MRIIDALRFMKVTKRHLEAEMKYPESVLTLVARVYTIVKALLALAVRGPTALIGGWVARFQAIARSSCAAITCSERIASS